MEYRRLGATNLLVSRLCFGGLTVGPLQANLDIETGAKIIAKAFDMGVNFIDTAKLYKTYPYIKRALSIAKNKNIVISAKSYDYTYEGMRESVKEAMEELGVKKIGIFSLHEQESRLTLKGHADALRYLNDAKKSGLIDAVGVSTHAIEVVSEICRMENVDVVHPIINMQGLGIMDGTIDEMLAAVEIAYKSGKGIYAMKAIGGGNLMNMSEKALKFVMNNQYIHSIAVGMQTVYEVEANINIFNGVELSEDLNKKLSGRSKKLHIDFWCEGCGKCVNACKNKSLSIKDNKAVVDEAKCLLCGYCSAYCPQFCIKIV